MAQRKKFERAGTVVTNMTKSMWAVCATVFLLAAALNVAIAFNAIRQGSDYAVRLAAGIVLATVGVATLMKRHD